MADPLFDDVKYLQHYEVNITDDVVATDWTIETNGGTIAHSTDEFRYVSGSLYTTGAADDTAEINQAPADLDLSLPFTIEVSVFPTNIANVTGIFIQGGGTVTDRFQMYINESGELDVYAVTGGSNKLISSTVGANIPAGSWTDVAVTYNGIDTIYLYINGVPNGGAFSGFSGYIPTSSEFRWGWARSGLPAPAADRSTNGYLDEMRITQADRYGGQVYIQGQFPDTGIIPDELIITSQPRDQTVFEGDYAGFGVTVTGGTGTIHYSWKQDGVSVGTDADNFIIQSTTAADDETEIWVVVTDDTAVLQSSIAWLVVDSAGDYPTAFPCPTWEFAATQTSFQRRTQFDSGWARQRLQWAYDGQQVSLTYKMTTTEFADWWAWVDAQGYQWFDANLDRVGGSLQLKTIRYTGPVSYTYSDFDTIVASLPAEIQND